MSVSHVSRCSPAASPPPLLNGARSVDGATCRSPARGHHWPSVRHASNSSAAFWPRRLRDHHPPRRCSRRGYLHRFCRHFHLTMVGVSPMPRSGPRKVRRYSGEFKLTAVRLSQQPGMQVQTVAAAPSTRCGGRCAARDVANSETGQPGAERRGAPPLEALGHQYFTGTHCCSKSSEPAQPVLSECVGSRCYGWRLRVDM